MDQKKQKILLGALAVCVLGMGSVWYFVRDRGPKRTTETADRTGEKKKRYAEATETKGKKKRATRKKAKKAKVATERKTREYKERTTKSKKKRKYGKKKKTKKVDVSPLAYGIQPMHQYVRNV